MQNRFLGFLFIGLASGVIGLAIGLFVGYEIGFGKAVKAQITNFDECAEAGYPIMDSYPEQCMTPEGEIFVREIDGTPLPSEEGIACTMDAKMCPDGTAVGRVPPTCEFAPCPGE